MCVSGNDGGLHPRERRRVELNVRRSCVLGDLRRSTRTATLVSGERQRGPRLVRERTRLYGRASGESGVRRFRFIAIMALATAAIAAAAAPAFAVGPPPDAGPPSDARCPPDVAPLHAVD